MNWRLLLVRNEHVTQDDLNFELRRRVPTLTPSVKVGLGLDSTLMTLKKTRKQTLHTVYHETVHAVIQRMQRKEERFD